MWNSILRLAAGQFEEIRRHVSSRKPSVPDLWFHDSSQLEGIHDGCTKAECSEVPIFSEINTLECAIQGTVIMNSLLAAIKTLSRISARNGSDFWKLNCFPA
jgi:hypothetical protein